MDQGAQQEAVSGFTCRICGDEERKRVYRCREMMFGLREEFEYVECASCGCLQISGLPEDMGRYYPAQYYSLSLRAQAAVRGRLRSFLIEQRLDSYLGNFNPLGRLLRFVVGEAYFNDPVAQHIPLSPRFAILDVGCGNGKRLLDWHRCGFSRLEGLDPYIDSDIRYENGVMVRKAELSEIDGSYDFVMANHSVEHIWNQQEVFRHLFRLLKPERYALVGVPVIPSRPWERFGVNWYGLDAPRHFYLHTRRSIEWLARDAGFELASVHFDEGSDHYWASVQYQNDIAALDSRSYNYGNNPAGHTFSPEQIAEFERLAIEDNETGRAAQARFYLFKRR